MFESNFAVNPRHSSSRLFMALALPLLSACAAFDADDSQTTEQILMTSGFEVVPAKTQEEMEALEELPQNVIQPTTREGKLMFVYADADNCRCAFWGDQAAYERYQKLETQTVAEPGEKDPASRIDPWAQGPWWVY